MKNNQLKIKQPRKYSYPLQILLAVLFLAIVWQIIAVWQAQQGPHAASLAPTWQTIFFEEFPGLSVFETGSGSVKNIASDWGLAAQVLLKNTWVTVQRVLIGIGLGFSIGVVMGILIGIQPTIRKIFYPVIKVIRNVPTLILISLFLVWFGGRESGIILFIAFSLWVIYCTSTIEAVSNVNPIHVNFARTLGAKKKDIYFSVIMPSIVPYLIDATRIAVGLCWAFALGGEYLIAQEGLGKILITSHAFMYVGRMIIVILMFIILTAIGNILVSLLAKRTYRWMA